MLALSCLLVRGPSISKHIYIYLPVTSKKQATSFAMFVYPGKIVRMRKSSSDYKGISFINLFSRYLSLIMRKLRLII